MPARALIPSWIATSGGYNSTALVNWSTVSSCVRILQIPVLLTCFPHDPKSAPEQLWQFILQ